ncbi:hypothetical protein [Brevundimonas sp.]|jgi:hypothetical protein|uniref:hypothetical protein n=1 Tax=Brevundimonas sp. TaxID=1871086 RepID=UPI0028B1D64A|nr:hypothetical protein [Brevundimonas sp.]
MTAVRRSKVIREAEKAARLAELKTRKDVADATGAEARKRSRLAEVETKLAWFIALKNLLPGTGLTAFLAIFIPALRR